MRITAVAARVVRWPIESRGAARGQWRERAAAIVGVRGEGGAGDATGLGEAAPLPGFSPDTVDDALAAVRELAARLPLTLESPAHAGAVAERVTSAPAARFGIETALLAALAQHARTSVAALWTPLPLGELRVAEVVDDEGEAIRAVARGVRCLKVKAETPAIVHAIAAVTPGIPLRVDANRRWPRADALRWLAELAHLPIDFVEEPCIDAHELLAEPLPCPIALDESLIDLSPSALDAALAAPDLGALVLKPTLLGGFARCSKLATRAHRAGVAPIISHSLEGPIGMAACIELARAVAADVPVGLGQHPALAGFWEHA